jgi:hypothetical protein
VGSFPTARGRLHSSRWFPEGKLTATMDQAVSKQARQAAEYLIGYLKTRTLPPRKVVLVKPELVTKATLQSG